MGYGNSKRQHLPSRRNNNQIAPYRHPTSPFSKNLSNDMRFGGRNNDVSGYVCRELIIEDAQGNKKIAREVQFFNSLRRIGEVKIE